MRAAAERIVPVSLELGGKSPSIVYPDADQDWAVDGIIAAMRFIQQSQSCNKQFTKVCKYVDEGLKRREFSLEGMPDSFTQRKSVTVNLAV